MLETKIKEKLKSYINFPKEGILFRDLMPILREPELFSRISEEMAENKIIRDSDAIIAVDARGFIFGSCIALLSKKPLITARKPGKLPGELITENYNLEYGSNSLSIQKEALNKYEKLAIVDDLLATGGTVKSVENIIKNQNKTITGLLVVVELEDLSARTKFNFPINSLIKY